MEVIGAASGSGIFTQSGGINVPYAAVPSGAGDTPDTGSFSSLQLGYSKGGYGEYDMSSGSLGVNVIYLAGNTNSQNPYNKAWMNAGTGVFTQTGGSVGSLGTLGLSSPSNNAIGLMVGGNWNGSQTNTSASATTYSSLGTYTLGNLNGTGSPLFVGGMECVGVSGTGSFTQNCGTNAIIGGGDLMRTATPGALQTPYDSYYGALMLGWYGGKQTYQKGYLGNGVGTYNLNGGLLTGGNPNATYGGKEVVGVAGTGIFHQTAGTNIAPPNSMSAAQTKAGRLS